MASRLPAAVDRLRQHLRGAIPDGDDLQQADQYILDAARTGFDAAPRGMGLDRGLQGDPEYPF